jgi:DNA-binding CsgD family transcriptional regulator
VSKSAQLRVEDVRAIVRLVGECRDLGDNLAAWEEHLFRTVGRLTGAVLVTAGELTGRWGRPVMVRPVSWGWENGLNQHGWNQALAHFQDDPTFSQGCMRYMERFRKEDGVANTQSDLLSEWEYEASTDYLSFRHVGVKHVLSCFWMLPRAGDRFRAICLFRAAGDRDFSRRDRVLLREVQATVVPLIGGPLARPGEPSPADLPPRVRQVLRCLLEGDGDKQIAARLGLTRHTVNEYAKAIFRHFGVQSRAELLVRWVRRGFPRGFSWEDGSQ